MIIFALFVITALLLMYGAAYNSIDATSDGVILLALSSALLLIS